MTENMKVFKLFRTICRNVSAKKNKPSNVNHSALSIYTYSMTDCNTQYFEAISRAY